MDITYSVSEILKCVEIINQPNGKILNYNGETFNKLNNTNNVKKKIIQSQGTFGETIETEELVEEEFDDAEPFEIEEIIKTNDLEVKKDKEKNEPLLLTTEVVNQSSRQKMNKKYIDVLEEELKLMTKIINESEDELGKYKNLNLSLNKQNAKLNEQILQLKKRNTQVENEFNKISNEINQQAPEEELQTKLEVIYKQQNIIKDYQDQISKLKEENKSLEQSSELPPSWLTGDSKYSQVLKSDMDKELGGLGQQDHNDELKAKSKFIYEQQNIIKDYQDQISKLKKENKLLEQNSEQTINQENIKEEMKDIAGKIKYYQDDNLRLSNELVKISNKLENTKNRLKYFEDNKDRLMTQLENLNSIISESNVIGNPFKNTLSRTDKLPEIQENKSLVDEKNSDKKKIVKNKFQNIITPSKVKNAEELNRLTKEIFKK